MNPIRIHLGPMPEMLRSIVTDLLGAESDMLIVGRSEAGQGALHDARRGFANVLITQDGEEGDSGCLEAVLSPGPLAVLAVSADGHHAAAVNLVRRSIPLDCESGPALAAAVRSLTHEEERAAPP
jgi:hypothetical protein